MSMNISIHKPVIMNIMDTKVIVVSNQMFGNTSVGFMFRAGSTNDYKGRNGLASMLSHIIMNCESNICKVQNMEKSGHVVKYHVDREYTYYDVSINISSYFEEVLSSLFSIVMCARISSTDFEIGKSFLISKVYIRQNNIPTWYHDMLHEAVFVRQMLGKPIDGKIKSIKSIGYDDLISFYKRCYAQKNSIITISTNLSINEIESVIKSIEFKFKNSCNNSYGLTSFKKYNFCVRNKSICRNINGVNMFYISHFSGIRDYQKKIYIDILHTMFSMSSFLPKGIICNNMMANISLNSFVYNNVGLSVLCVASHMSSRSAVTNMIFSMFKNRVLSRDIFNSAAKVLKNNLMSNLYNSSAMCFAFSYYFINLKKIYKPCIDFDIIGISNFDHFKEFVERMFNHVTENFSFISIGGRIHKSYM